MPSIGLSRQVIWQIGICALLLASQVPILYRYVNRTWGDANYQHFPIVLAAVAYLLWERRKQIVADTSPQGAFAIGTVALSVAAMMTAVLLYSSFLGILSVLLTWLSVGYWLGGARVLIHAAPVLVVGLFAIPLPFGLADKLVFELQFLASQLASFILDATGQWNVLQGVVLITPENQFAAEEACSGIRSLFSSLAAVTVFCVLRAYPWWRVALNWIQTISWVLVGNAIRIAAVVYLAANNKYWWTEGTGHAILGLLSFTMVLVCALSADQIIQFVVLRRELRTKYGGFVETVEDEESPLESSMNPPLPPKPKEGSDRLDSGNTAKPRGQTIPSWQVAVVIVLILLNGAFGAYVHQQRHRGLARNQTQYEAQTPTADWLPTQIRDWSLEGFEHIERGEGKIQAPESFVWTYQNGSVMALVSIDRPFDTWHNLDACYRALGWQTLVSHGLQMGPAAGDVAEPNLDRDRGRLFSRIWMESFNRYGVVLFSAVDRAGEQVLPPFLQVVGSGLDTIWPRAKFEAAISLGAARDLQIVDLPVSTIQIYSESPMRLEESEVDEIQYLFSQVSSRLVAAMQQEQ
ncbi:MAG: exosortase U [Aureliella sp.]